jgi:hypothetical protein
VFSYAPDENDLVEDPLLAEHLSHWGIDAMRMEKTEKSMAELNVALNKSFEFDKITEAGAHLAPLSGPGYMGLTNLGNSCYLNSVVQVRGPGLTSLPATWALRTWATRATSTRWFRCGGRVSPPSRLHGPYEPGQLVLPQLGGSGAGAGSHLPPPPSVSPAGRRRAQQGHSYITRNPCLPACPRRSYV